MARPAQEAGTVRHHSKAWLGLAALLAASGPALAQPGPASPPAQNAGAPAFTPTIAFGGYVQAQFDAGAAGDARFGPADRFYLRRVRFTVTGNAMPTLAFRLQSELAGGIGASSAVKASATDVYLEWAGAPAAHLRVGQFKGPFGREYLLASTQLDVIERTLASDRLTLGRQIGIEVLGSGYGGRVGYLAALLNGNGSNATVNDNRDFMYVGRGTLRPWTRTGSGVLEIGASAYWSRDAALNVSKEFALDSTPDTPAVDNLFTGRRAGAGLDGHMEWGVWRADVEWLRVRFDQDAGGPHAVVTSDGWFAQPAAFVHGRTVEVIGRYERFRPDVRIAGNMTSSWLAGVNYYARGNAAKLMANYLWVDTPASAESHAKVLARLQVTF